MESTQTGQPPRLLPRGVGNNREMAAESQYCPLARGGLPSGLVGARTSPRARSRVRFENQPGGGPDGAGKVLFPCPGEVLAPPGTAGRPPQVLPRGEGGTAGWPLAPSVPESAVLEITGLDAVLAKNAHIAHTH